MTPKQIEQLAEIRRTLKTAYDDYLTRTPDAHKMSEGFVSVSYPTIFADGDYLSPEAYRIEIYSYVFGAGRTHTFERGIADHRSSTHLSADPFEAALAEVKNWLAEQLAREAE